VLLADFVYALVVAAFVARRLAGCSRRGAGARGVAAASALMRVFTVMALAPTLLVAVFATITLNFGLEGWFSDRVRNVVANSLAAAQAYEDEHRRTLQADARLLADSSTSRRRATRC
jgi:two-component system nitrogen regulation sensor histidine kinase NtrY